MAKRILQRIELWNLRHEEEIAAGRRRAEVVDAKVDNGSAYTVLPGPLAAKLGLAPARRVRVTYADGRQEERELVRGLVIRIPEWPDREVTTDALVEPGRRTVLLGCEEMERMDLIADHRRGVLRPRPGTEQGIVAELD